MKDTFKSHGKTYQVKQTGIVTKHTKEHTDFNGYEIEAKTTTTEKYGVFDGDTQVGKVHADRSVIINGNKVGKI